MFERILDLPRINLPKEAIDQRRERLEKLSQRVRVSPDQMQARRDELDLIQEIFVARKSQA